MTESFFWENLVKFWWVNGIFKVISKIQRTDCAAPEALEHSALERRRRCLRAAATFRTVVGMVLLEVLKKKVCFTAMSAM